MSTWYEAGAPWSGVSMRLYEVDFRQAHMLSHGAPVTAGDILAGSLEKLWLGGVCRGFRELNL